MSTPCDLNYVSLPSGMLLVDCSDAAVVLREVMFSSSAPPAASLLSLTPSPKLPASCILFTCIYSRFAETCDANSNSSDWVGHLVFKLGYTVCIQCNLSEMCSSHIRVYLWKLTASHSLPVRLSLASTQIYCQSISAYVRLKFLVLFFVICEVKAADFFTQSERVKVGFLLKVQS